MYSVDDIKDCLEELYAKGKIIKEVDGKRKIFYKVVEGA
jgi:hypothetical protein